MIGWSLQSRGLFCCSIVTWFSVVQGFGDHCQLGEVRLPTVHSCPVSGMLIDTSLEVFPSQARLARFRHVVTSFLPLPSPPACMWQQLLGHMASQERFLPRGCSLAHRRDVNLHHYLDDWLVTAESRTLLLQHCIVNWEKSDFQPSTLGPVSGMLIDTSLEVFPSQARLCFRHVVTSFLPPHPQHACGSNCWATWLRRSAFFLEVAPTCVLCSVTSRTTGPPWWTTRPFRFLCRRSAWRQLLVAPEGLMGTWRPSPSLLLYTDVCL